jgi:hypothetical protein
MPVTSAGAAAARLGACGQSFSIGVYRTLHGSIEMESRSNTITLIDRLNDINMSPSERALAKAYLDHGEFFAGVILGVSKALRTSVRALISALAKAYLVRASGRVARPFW